MSLCLVLSLNRNNETLVFAVSGKSEWHPVSFCRQDDTLYHSRPDNEGYLTTESLTHVNSPPLAPRGSSQSRFGINHVLQGICWSLKITLLFLFCCLFSPFRRIWICKATKWLWEHSMSTSRAGGWKRVQDESSYSFQLSFTLRRLIFLIRIFWWLHFGWVGVPF